MRPKTSFISIVGVLSGPGDLPICIYVMALVIQLIIRNNTGFELIIAHLQLHKYVTYK